MPVPSHLLRQRGGEVIHGHQEVHPLFGRGTFVRRRSRCRALIDRRAIPRRFVNLDDGGGGGSDTRGIFLRVVRLRLRLCGCLRGRLRLRLRLARDRRLLPLLLTEFTFEFFPARDFFLVDVDDDDVRVLDAETDVATAAASSSARDSPSFSSLSSSSSFELDSGELCFSFTAPAPSSDVARSPAANRRRRARGGRMTHPPRDRKSSDADAELAREGLARARDGRAASRV